MKLVTLITSLLLFTQLPAQDTNLTKNESTEQEFEELLDSLFDEILLKEKLVGQTEDTLFKIFTKKYFPDNKYVLRYNKAGHEEEWWIDSLLFDGFQTTKIDSIILRTIQIDGKGLPELVLYYDIGDHRTIADLSSNLKYQGEGHMYKVNKVINLETQKELFSGVNSYMGWRLRGFRKHDIRGRIYCDTASYSYDFWIDSTGLITVNNLKTFCVYFWDNKKNDYSEDHRCNELVDHKEGAYHFIDGEYKWTPFLLEMMKQEKYRIYDEYSSYLNKTEGIEIDDIFRITQRIFKYDQPAIENRGKYGNQLLNTVAWFMERNPKIAVEVRTHLSGGADNYSQNLSKKRAYAIVDYLEHRGIQRKRVIPKGYGHTQPIIDEKAMKMLGAEEQHKAHEKNRRTEFVIINIDFNADEK